MKIIFDVISGPNSICSRFPSFVRNEVQLSPTPHTHTLYLAPASFLYSTALCREWTRLLVYDWLRATHARANAADSSFSLFTVILRDRNSHRDNKSNFCGIEVREREIMEQKPFIVNNAVRSGQQAVQGKCCFYI